jgi:hypothetical protein
MFFTHSRKTLDIFWARKNIHMADAVFAYAPAQKVVMEGERRQHARGSQRVFAQPHSGCVEQRIGDGGGRRPHQFFAASAVVLPPGCQMSADVLRCPDFRYFRQGPTLIK